MNRTQLICGCHQMSGGLEQLHNLRRGEFDENKEYGNNVIVHHEHEINDDVKAVLRQNMELLIPKKFRKFAICPIIRHRKATTIQVKGDNYEQLGAKKDEIGERLDIPEHWTVGWIYRKTR